MKKITILNVIVLLSSLGLVACGGGGGGGTPASTTTTTPPTVVSTTPADSATGVLTNTTLSVTFNVDMDAATITNSNFTLAGANPVSGKISYNTATRTATFTPDAPLKPGTTFTASLTTSITDSAGNALTTVFKGGFSTEGFIRRVSVDSNGTEATNSSFAPNTSADGRYVVFQSNATDLIGTADTNNKLDIFLRDTQTGKTTRISESTKGVEANGDSSNPAISANGRFVVFQSSADNLIDGSTDSNTRNDVFVHNIQNNTTTLVSVDNSGTGAPANYSSTYPSISADGHFITFTSNATNLVAVDNNSSTDVFVRDTQKETTVLVSVDGSDKQAIGKSNKSHISGNGQYVTFVSNAKLAPSDTNGISDIYVRDRINNTTTLVSVGNNGKQSAAGVCYSSSISANGQYIAFTSAATDFVTVGTKNFRTNIFIRDTKGPGATTLVSMSSGTASSASLGDDASYAPAISADGRYVAFQSEATNLIGANADNNGWPDVFVRDTTANTTIRVNVDNTGTAGTGIGINTDSSPAISADGRYVVFNTDVDTLTPPDGNGSSDVFRVLNATP